MKNVYSKEILIIGNAPSVLLRKKGKDIDHFGTVVRFNNYQIDGFQDYVGSKVDIWARNNSERTLDRDYRQFKQVLICNPPQIFTSNQNYNSALDLKNRIPNSILIPDKEKVLLQKELFLAGSKKSIAYRMIISKYGKNNKWGIKEGWVSSGIMVLNYFLLRYAKIYIYGFDFFSTDKNGRPNHYYEKDIITYKMHNGEREKGWVFKQINKGKIIFL